MYSRYQKLMLRSIALNLDRTLENYTKRSKKHLDEYFSLSQIAYKHYKEPWTMPRQSKKYDDKKLQGKNDAQTEQWLNIRLDDEMGQDLLQVFDTDESIFKVLASYFNDGFNLSVTFKPTNDNYACYLSGCYIAGDDTVYKISAYAPNATFAIAVGLYKLQLFHENSEMYKSDKPRMAFG